MVSSRLHLGVSARRRRNGEFDVQHPRFPFSTSACCDMKLRAAHLAHSRGMHVVDPQSRARQMRRVFASRVPAADWSRVFLAEGESFPPERSRRIHQSQPSEFATGDANTQSMGIGVLWRGGRRHAGAVLFLAPTPSHIWWARYCGIGVGIPRACAWEQRSSLQWQPNATQRSGTLSNRGFACALLFLVLCFHKVIVGGIGANSSCTTQVPEREL